MPEGIIDKIGSMFKRNPVKPAVALVESHRRRESQHKPLTLEDFVNWSALRSVGDSYGSMSETADEGTRREYVRRSYSAQTKFYSTQDGRTVEEMIGDSLSEGTLSQEDGEILRRHFNHVASSGDEALKDLREQIRIKNDAYHTHGKPEYDELG